MHLVFYIRGIYNQVELWKTLAQGQFYKWIRTDLKTGKDVEILFQGALRPSVLGTWEFIFPENALAEVLSTMVPLGNTLGVEKTFIAEARLAVLRKILGVKKIPKKIMDEAKEIPESLTIEGSQRGLSHMKIPGVAVHLIGFKKDKYGQMNDPKTGKKYYQELL